MEVAEERNLVYQVFTKIQQEPRKEEQFAEILAKAYCNRPETFIKHFSSCVYTLLAFKGSGKEIDNLMKFTSTVITRCIGDTEVPILAPLMIEDLINYTKAKERFVRQRCLLIINQVLTKSKILDLESSLLRKLKSCYMERSRDKVIAVRNAAAYGLCRLQNSIDPDEEVLQLVASNIRCEPNTMIRRLYASNILVHSITTHSIVETLRDEELSIRVAMLKNLEDHSVIQDLTLELRLAIIHCLEDRNEIIVKSSENLIIQNWMKKNSIPMVLSLLNIEQEETAGELLLNVVLLHEEKTGRPSFTSQVQISFNQLSTLTSFYLYCCTRFYFEHEHNTEIDSLVTDIPQFCHSIRELAVSTTMSSSIQQVVFRNQIRCLQYLDTLDSVCREEILSLIRFFLTLSSSVQIDLVINQENVFLLLQALLGLLDKETLFLYEVSLIISDIEDLVEKGMEGYSKDQVSLFLLYLVQGAFKLVSTKAFSLPEIRTFFDKIVSVNLESPVAQLRQEAVKGVILMAIMSKEVAFQYCSLLLCMMLEEEEDEEVQYAAIRGLTDIVIVYGDMKAGASQDSEMGVSVKEIVDGLNLYVFHSVERLQCSACEALCKLFLFDKIRSIPDLSNLFLLLFDSLTEKRTLLRQILAVFFPSFCNPIIDKNCRLFEEAVIYTMKGIAEASIPDRYTMMSSMSSFFLALMTVNHKKSEKRQYVASDDEQSEEQGSGNEYHSCVMEFVQKFFEIANSKLDDSPFIKEAVGVICQIDGYLLNKEDRGKVNNLIIGFQSNLDNQTVKRQLKAKNKAFCTIDPSLVKL